MFIGSCFLEDNNSIIFFLDFCLFYLLVYIFSLIMVCVCVCVREKVGGRKWGEDGDGMVVREGDMVVVIY